MLCASSCFVRLNCRCTRKMKRVLRLWVMFWRGYTHRIALAGGVYLFRLLRHKLCVELLLSCLLVNTMCTCRTTLLIAVSAQSYRLIVSPDVLHDKRVSSLPSLCGSLLGLITPTLLRWRVDCRPPRLRCAPGYLIGTLLSPGIAAGPTRVLGLYPATSPVKAGDPVPGYLVDFHSLALRTTEDSPIQRLSAVG